MSLLGFSFHLWITFTLVPAFVSRFCHIQPTLMGQNPSSVSRLCVLSVQEGRGIAGASRTFRIPAPPAPTWLGVRPGGSWAGSERSAHAPGTRQGPARVTDSGSPHRKWEAARWEEPAVAWRLRAGLWASGPRGLRFSLRAMAEAADAVRLLLSSTALWLLLLGAGTASASKAVTAHLTAKWPETPLLLEAR